MLFKKREALNKFKKAALDYDNVLNLGVLRTCYYELDLLSLYLYSEREGKKGMQRE